MAELRLPRRPGDVRDEPALGVQRRQRRRRVENAVERTRRVVDLVEHREEDLRVRVDRPAGVLVVVPRLAHGQPARGVEEREHGRRGQEVLHEDRRELDEVRRAARARDVLVLRLPNHRWGDRQPNEINRGCNGAYSAWRAPFRGRASGLRAIRGR